MLRGCKVANCSCFQNHIHIKRRYLGSLDSTINMQKFINLVALATLLTNASAQYSINPNSVPLSTRDAWCESQLAQCPQICLQTSAHSSETRENDCVAKTLTYSCVCSNGVSPNVSQYSLTLPYYICQEWGNQCVAACGQDNTCSSACREDHPCGAQDPR